MASLIVITSLGASPCSPRLPEIYAIFNLVLIETNSEMVGNNAKLQTS